MSKKMEPKRKLNRGAYQREACVFVGVWVPSEWSRQIDRAVRLLDVDRSKFFRAALAEKLNGGRS